MIESTLSNLISLNYFSGQSFGVHSCLFCFIGFIVQETAGKRISEIFKPENVANYKSRVESIA